MLINNFINNADKLTNILKPIIKDMDLHFYNITDYRIHYLQYRVFITNISNKEVIDYVATNGFDILKSKEVKKDYFIFELFNTKYLTLECRLWSNKNNDGNIKLENINPIDSFDTQGDNQLSEITTKIMEFIKENIIDIK